MYTLHLSGFPINLFLSSDNRFLVFGVIFVISVVKLKHLVGRSMRVIPNEFIGLIKLFGFEYLLLDGVGGVRDYRFEIVFLDG